jgi:superfamily II DNA or RNA helicase
MKFVFDWDDKKKSAIVQTDYLDVLREGLSIEDKQTSFSLYKRNRKWTNVRKYPIKPSGYFNIYMFPEIYDFLKQIETPYSCIITEKFKEKFKPSIIKNDFDYEVLGLDLLPRAYQDECVVKCLKQGRGVCEIATAGGKTLIMAMLIYNIHFLKKKTKTLVITTPQLVNQTYNDFLDYGLSKHLSISKWDGSNKYHDTDVIITNNIILTSKKQDLTVLKKISLLLYDECHKLRKQNTINKVFSKFKPLHTYGFTGSLPEDKSDIWNIIGHLGPIIFSKKGSELRDEKYIADAKVLGINLKYKNPIKYTQRPSIDNPLGMYLEECEFLYNSDFRNDTISQLCKNINMNTLILVDRLEHQQTLADTIKNKAKDKNVKIIKGDVPSEDREKIKKIMEQSDNVICIAMSAIFATGISINNIHYIIFAQPGKAKIRLLQSIGRGLRLHKNKSKLFIIDIVDDTHYGLLHHEQRLDLYKDEKIEYEEKTIRER